MVEVQGPAEIVIVTGISGAGRRTAAHTMEDLGWYVVDNLPPAMLPILVDRMGTAERLAVVVDVRSREEFEQLPTAFAEVKARGYRVTVLFLEASDDVIVQRQESNRRPLPLAPVDPGEVANVLQLRISQLSDPTTRVTATVPGGYRGPGFQLGDLFIWGMTAHLLDVTLRVAGWERSWDRDREAPVPGRFLRD